MLGLVVVLWLLIMLHFSVVLCMGEGMEVLYRVVLVEGRKKGESRK